MKGGRERGGGRVGPRPFEQSWLGLPSRTARGPSTDLPRDTSLRIAQRISCTLHRENARAILRRSPGSVSGSCCCVSFPPVPVSVCPPFCVCCLSLFVAPSLGLVLFVCFFGSAVGFCCDVFAPFPPGLEIFLFCPPHCLTPVFQRFSTLSVSGSFLW